MEKRVLDDRETTGIYAREVHTTGTAMNVAGGEQKVRISTKLALQMLSHR
jgi:hypothetical protein